MDNIKQNTLPWVEKYRPKNLDDVISHNVIVETLNNFIKKKDLPHLLFHGPPGTGKTSTIITVAKALYKDKYNVMTMEINASEERGIEVVRNRIIQFANSKNLLFDNIDTSFKLIILDEADAMTTDAQASLRRVIEKYTKNIRFCLICNYIKKIDLAIQSRCTCFRFAPLRYISIKQKILDVIEQENIKYDKAGIDTIIKRSKYDMRKVYNILQSVSMSYDIINEYNVDKCLGYPCKKDIYNIIYSMINDTYIKSFNILKNYIESQGYSLTDIIIEVHDYLINKLQNNSLNDNINISENQIMNIIENLGNIEYNTANCTNVILQLGAFIGIFNLYSKK